MPQASELDFRKGSLIDLMARYPDEASAARWFESAVWGDDRRCPKCGSGGTRPASHPRMPYWCGGCRSYFSVRTMTSMARSRIPLRKWLLAIHVVMDAIDSVSSVTLHRAISVPQATAWGMLRRMREAWAQSSASGISE